MTRRRIVLIILLVLVCITYIPDIYTRLMGSGGGGMVPATIQKAQSVLPSLPALPKSANREQLDVARLKANRHQPQALDDPFIDQKSLTSRPSVGLSGGPAMGFPTNGQFPGGVRAGQPGAGQFPGAPPPGGNPQGMPLGGGDRGLTVTGIGQSNGVSVAVILLNGKSATVRIGDKIDAMKIEDIDYREGTVTVIGPTGSQTAKIGGK